MSEKGQRFRAFFTDRRIALIIRWWAAGAIYFFFGWGTSLGNQAEILDFVFWLGVAMGVFNMLVVNPVLRMGFNIGPDSRSSRGNYALSQRVSDYLVEIIKNVVIMFLIALIYVGINSAINVVFGLPATNISLPGEPILFGIFYVFVWSLFGWITQRIVASFQASRK
ncbi:MAG: hypothetical protein AAGD96_02215 [Chloroflexota bacterium]